MNLNRENARILQIVATILLRLVIYRSQDLSYTGKFTLIEPPNKKKIETEMKLRKSATLNW